MTAKKNSRLKNGKELKIYARITTQFYHLTFSDLVLLKESFSSGPMLDFGLFCIGISIAFLTYFLSAKISGLMHFCIVISMIFLFFIIGVLFIILWINGRRKSKNLMKRIQCQKLEFDP